MFPPSEQNRAGSAGHSLGSHGLVEAGGYWDWSELIKGSFCGGVLPGARAQGQSLPADFLVQSVMESTGVVYPGLQGSTHYVFLTILHPEEPLTCVPWAGATEEVCRNFPVFYENLGFFQKIVLHCMGSGLIMHFSTPLPHCGLLTTVELFYSKQEQRITHAVIIKYYSHYS